MFTIENIPVNIIALIITQVNTIYTKDNIHIESIADQATEIFTIEKGPIAAFFRKKNILLPKDILVTKDTIDPSKEDTKNIILQNKKELDTQDIIISTE
jgi:hypothetical protein